MLKEIYAIWLREIKKAFSDKWEFVVSIGWPLFIIFVIGIGVDSFVNLQDYGVSYIEILGPGMIALFVVGGAASIGNSIIEDQKGFIKELLVAPISRASIFIGKVFGEMTVNLATALVTLILFLAFIGLFNFVSLLWALLFMIILAFGFYGFGIVLSFLFKKAKTYQLISGIITAILMFLSGAFFPIKNLPPTFKFFVKLNPLTYGVDGLRGVLTGFSEFSLALNLAVIIVFGFVMLILGSWLFRKSIEK